PRPRLERTSASQERMRTYGARRAPKGPGASSRENKRAQPKLSPLLCQVGGTSGGPRPASSSENAPMIRRSARKAVAAIIPANSQLRFLSIFFADGLVSAQRGKLTSSRFHIVEAPPR